MTRRFPTAVMGCQPFPETSRAERSIHMLVNIMSAMRMDGARASEKSQRGRERESERAFEKSKAFFLSFDPETSCFPI